MLVEELKKVRVNKYPFHDAGIVMFCPTNCVFYKIAFGDGTDDEPVDDCDDYLYLTEDAYDEYGELQADIDGGNMWFHRKDYTGYINDGKLIRNALEFLNCPDIEGCVFIRQYR